MYTIKYFQINHYDEYVSPDGNVNVTIKLYPMALMDIVSVVCIQFMLIKPGATNAFHITRIYLFVKDFRA